MKVKYKFIDDAATSEERSNEDLGPLIDNVEYGCEALKIDAVYPGQFDDQLSLLRKSDFDGLILDLRLDEFAPPPNDNAGDQKKPNYRATAFAQEIRTRATERNLNEFPIVLWSYKDKMKRSYFKDDTSHDLFDMMCEKEDLQNLDRAKKIGKQLIALVEGYDAILKARNRKRGPGTQFYKFLGFEKKPGFIDPRIMSYFEGRETQLPAHEYARFIIRELLDIPGPLITEDILAARLGVDIERSEYWNALKERLPDEARYGGPFHHGWPRWWAFRIEEWWKGLADCPGPLKRLKADDRVSFLRSATSLTRLYPADPIEDSYSNRYWTVCQGSDKPKDPLDPINGFIVDRKNKRPWQDELYLSENAALQGLGRDKGLRVDPLERDRLKSVKRKKEKQLRRE
jgi:hypothetical protein